MNIYDTVRLPEAIVKAFSSIPMPGIAARRKRARWSHPL